MRRALFSVVNDRYLHLLETRSLDGLSPLLLDIFSKTSDEEILLAFEQYLSSGQDAAGVYDDAAVADLVKTLFVAYLESVRVRSDGLINIETSPLCFGKSEELSETACFWDAFSPRILYPFVLFDRRNLMAAIMPFRCVQEKYFLLSKSLLALYTAHSVDMKVSLSSMIHVAYSSLVGKFSERDIELEFHTLFFEKVFASMMEQKFQFLTPSAKAILKDCLASIFLLPRPEYIHVVQSLLERVFRTMGEGDISALYKALEGAKGAGAAVKYNQRNFLNARKTLRFLSSLALMFIQLSYGKNTYDISSVFSSAALYYIKIHIFFGYPQQKLDKFFSFLRLSVGRPVPMSEKMNVIKELCGHYTTKIVSKSAEESFIRFLTEALADEETITKEIWSFIFACRFYEKESAEAFYTFLRALSAHVLTFLDLFPGSMDDSMFRNFLLMAYTMCPEVHEIVLRMGYIKSVINRYNTGATSDQDRRVCREIIEQFVERNKTCSPLRFSEEPDVFLLMMDGLGEHDRFLEQAFKGLVHKTQIDIDDILIALYKHFDDRKVFFRMFLLLKDYVTDNKSQLTLEFLRMLVKDSECVMNKTLRALRTCLIHNTSLVEKTLGDSVFEESLEQSIRKFLERTTRKEKLSEFFRISRSLAINNLMPFNLQTNYEVRFPMILKIGVRTFTGLALDELLADLYGLCNASSHNVVKCTDSGLVDELLRLAGRNKLALDVLIVMVSNRYDLKEWDILSKLDSKSFYHVLHRSLEQVHRMQCPKSFLDLMHPQRSVSLGMFTGLQTKACRARITLRIESLSKMMILAVHEITSVYKGFFVSAGPGDTDSIRFEVRVVNSNRETRWSWEIPIEHVFRRWVLVSITVQGTKADVRCGPKELQGIHGHTHRAAGVPPQTGSSHCRIAVQGQVSQFVLVNETREGKYLRHAEGESQEIVASLKLSHLSDAIEYVDLRRRLSMDQLERGKPDDEDLGNLLKAQISIVVYNLQHSLDAFGQIEALRRNLEKYRQRIAGTVILHLDNRLHDLFRDRDKDNGVTRFVVSVLMNFSRIWKYVSADVWARYWEVIARHIDGIQKQIGLEYFLGVVLESNKSIEQGPGAYSVFLQLLDDYPSFVRLVLKACRRREVSMPNAYTELSKLFYGWLLERASGMSLTSSQIRMIRDGMNIPRYFESIDHRNGARADLNLMTLALGVDVLEKNGVFVNSKYLDVVFDRLSNLNERLYDKISTLEYGEFISRRNFLIATLVRRLNRHNVFSSSWRLKKVLDDNIDYLIRRHTMIASLVKIVAKKKKNSDQALYVLTEFLTRVFKTRKVELLTKWYLSVHFRLGERSLEDELFNIFRGVYEGMASQKSYMRRNLGDFLAFYREKVRPDREIEDCSSGGSLFCIIWSKSSVAPRESFWGSGLTKRLCKTMEGVKSAVSCEFDGLSKLETGSLNI